MRKNRCIHAGVVLAATLVSSLLHGQGAPNRVVAAGYEAPPAIAVAPGQVITLFVRSDAGQPERAVEASSVPLPVELGGYAVTLEQTLYSRPLEVPLFVVYPLTTCYGLAPSICDRLTAITVQIPWELAPNVAGSGRAANFALLRVSYQGRAGEAFPLDPVPDRIHIVNSCDATRPPGAVSQSPTAGCRPVVTHADGELVTAANPAREGESLVVYALAGDYA